MTKVNRNTQKAEQLISSYIYARSKGIKSVYAAYKGVVSAKKTQAYENDCLGQKAELNGRAGFICGASSHFFSYAFVYDAVDEETGVVRQHLRYITHAHNYDVELNEGEVVA